MPWLFRAFDTIQFKRVAQDEFDEALRAFDRGTYQFDIKEEEFDVGAQLAFEDSIAAEVKDFREKQAISLKAITAEEAKLFAEWSEDQEKARAGGEISASADELQRTPGAIAIKSPMNASVWKVLVKAGDKIEPGQKIAVLEAMKTEQDIFASDGMTSILGVLVKPGDPVRSGDVIAVGK